MLKYTPPDVKLVICDGVRVHVAFTNDPTGSVQITSPLDPGPDVTGVHTAMSILHSSHRTHQTHTRHTGTLDTVPTAH